MCGRYGLREDPAQIADLFSAGDEAQRASIVESLANLDPPITPRFNIAPTTNNVILVPNDEGLLVARYARWGLIPHWVKDPSTFRATLFNARSETAHEKPSFRDAFKKKRCVVPVSGFYEWQAQEGGGPKQPYWIQRRDCAAMALGGLYAEREGAAGTETSYTILTTRPAALLAKLHDREPVRVPPPLLQAWLDPSRNDAATLSDFLEPGDPHDLEAVPVSTAVNRAGTEQEGLLDPIGESLRV